MLPRLLQGAIPGMLPRLLQDDIPGMLPRLLQGAIPGMLPRLLQGDIAGIPPRPLHGEPLPPLAQGICARGSCSGNGLFDLLWYPMASSMASMPATNGFC